MFLLKDIVGKKFCVCVGGVLTFRNMANLHLHLLLFIMRKDTI